MIDENSFQGTVPACFGDLQNLRQLYVFRNELTGDLPLELSELSWLSKLLHSIELRRGKCVNLANTSPDQTRHLQLDLALKRIILGAPFL